MLRRIWALVQKESIQLVRMPIVYVGLTLGPALELILFAAAIHTDVKHIPMVVADQSLSAASRTYLGGFTNSDSFDIVATVPDQVGVIHAIDSGQAEIGIFIPTDFALQVVQKQATVLILVDGSNSFVTQSALSSAKAISQQYAIRLTNLQISPLNSHMQILYNPDLRDVWFLVPGICAFLLYGIALKLTAFSIVREREAGTIEALLVTPIRPIELMIGKMIPNLGIAFIDLAFTFFLGTVMFGVPFRGSLLLFSALALLFAIGSLGLGLMISSVSQTQVQANQLASLTNIAVLFVSGFLFPAYSLPLILRLLGYIMPMTFFMAITTGIMVKGTGLGDLWIPALSLGILTTAILVISALLFRQNLE
jgi:ABC-2 type transport system permease protein